ncbi:MAG TPA: hypothetical protein VJJ23_03325 [Candidatus Nanoarchaeia archaeon]|nr:hypothetical protein [Candidatus Nanoarchaeia archaeon]
MQDVDNELITLTKKVYSFFSLKNPQKLRDLSTEAINHASLHQDNFSIFLSIISYSLSKILEKHQSEYNFNEFYKKVKIEIKNTISLLEKNDNSIDLQTKKILTTIKSFDKRLNLYIEEMLSSSAIKKGSKFYEYGISIGRISELLGISKWDLLNYIGNTTIADISINKTIPIEKRIEITKKVFNIK